MTEYEHLDRLADYLNGMPRINSVSKEIQPPHLEVVRDDGALFLIGSDESSYRVDVHHSLDSCCTGMNGKGVVIHPYEPDVAETTPEAVYMSILLTDRPQRGKP